MAELTIIINGLDHISARKPEGAAALVSALPITYAGVE